jgi:hypothetical protein
MIDLEDRRWVLMEENIPCICLLTKTEAEVEKQKMKMKFPQLNYTLFFDAYYEYSEIINEN